MSTYHPLPRLPLVDLSNNYLSYLEGIDAENQERHLYGEPLLEYPSYEDFVDMCRENGFRHSVQVCAHVMDFDSIGRVLDEEFTDDPDLKWLIAMPAFSIACEDEENVDSVVPEGFQWVTPHGSFVFPSSTRH